MQVLEKLDKIDLRFYQIELFVVRKNKLLSKLKNQTIGNDQFKMNEIINKFLLNGNKFTSELHLKQPGFTYSACRHLTKHREGMQKFRETGT